jgi:hypothetical protein
MSGFNEIPQSLHKFSLQEMSGMAAPHAGPRPRVNGKFLFIGEEKFWVKGVTYGTFEPDANGLQFPLQQQVEKDFQQMAASGINAVRTYTVPPVWLLDTALQAGLRVMVGIPWEQHVTFLDDRRGLQCASVRTTVQSCAMW